MAADLRACMSDLASGPGVTVSWDDTPSAAIPTQPTATAGITGLHLSTRFESDAALARLAEPRGEDRRRMAPATGPAPFLRRWFGDLPLMTALALVAAAAAAAWYVAYLS
jgi:hypothetical protein